MEEFHECKSCDCGKHSLTIQPKLLYGLLGAKMLELCNDLWLSEDGQVVARCAYICKCTSPLYSGNRSIAAV